MNSLLVEQQDRVLVLTINTPEVRNAIDNDILTGIREALEAAPSQGVGAAVLTGAGGAFSSGLNLKKAVAQGMSADAVEQNLSNVFHPAIKAIRQAPFPVIAAVDGYAGGFGFDMALACDLRVISERAKFGELFIRIGLIPDGGGTYLLPRVVGLGRALELMMSGRDVDAVEALQIGLANRQFYQANFMQDAISYASALASQSPEALRRGKQLMLAALNSSFEEALSQEARNQKEILQSPNGQEGFIAFLEKRAPIWK